MTENKTEKILKQVQNDKSVETGRTMLEIVGVLVIVGILSVSSIWALSQAFNKNSANEITYELSQRAIAISSIKEGKSEASLDEFKDSGFTKKYNITYNNDEGEGFFSITMENVSDGVVEQLKQMGWDLPYNVYVNGVHLDDYNPKTKEPKESFLKSVFIKSAMAADKGDNVIKFVFNNKLDKNIKPDYIDEEECINTSGKWGGERCFCPTGSYMTPAGCVTKCGGDTGIDCPDETICYRDEECRGCLEICDNGKCVVDKNNKANGVPYCDGTKIITSIMSGSKDTACATNTTAKDCAVYGVDMTCAEENGEAKCVHKAECSKDADCLGCFEVCTDGKCVIDESELSYCMGTKLITLTQITGDKENGCFIEPEEQDCTIHGPEFTCSEESGEAKCVSQAQVANTCGGHGTWNTETNMCDCDEGYAVAQYGGGDPLTINPDNHTYVQTCVLDESINCGEHGTWNASKHMCDCDEGYKSFSSRSLTYCILDEKCSGHGELVQKEDCSTGSSGCVVYDVCECDEGYVLVNSGDICYKADLNDCGGHGVWDGDTCRCEDGYSLSDVWSPEQGTNYPTCIKSVIKDCGGHGVWDGRTCRCEDGYSLSDVWSPEQGTNYPTCIKSVIKDCGGHGVWDGRTCRCEDGYSLSDVWSPEQGNYPTCVPTDENPCQNGTFDETTQKCICDEGWGGDKCNINTEETCASGLFKTEAGDCMPCSELDDRGYFTTNNSDCATCSNVAVKNGVCYQKCASGSFMDMGGYCVSCSELGDRGYFTINNSDCATCSNVAVKNGACYQKCASGSFMDMGGYCVSCSELGDRGYFTINNSDCATCSNVAVKNGACYQKCASGSFMDMGGYCVSCSELGDRGYFTINNSDCATCSNVAVKNGACYQKCASGSFMDMGGYCVSCSELGDRGYFTINNSDCATCSNADVKNGVCYQKCASGFSMDMNGNCISDDNGTSEGGLIEAGDSSLMDQIKDDSGILIKEDE